MKSIENLITSFAFVAMLFISATVFGVPSEAELMKEAKVSRAQAEKTALGKVHNGTIKSAELEREHGKLIWSFDIGESRTKSITEVQVDAKEGKIISVQIESPRDQAKEAAQEESKK